MKVAEKNLTTWYPAHVHPARVGVYQMYGPISPLMHRSTIVYRYWDGKHWYYGSYTGPYEAFRIYRACNKNHRNWIDSTDITKWRGLNVEPKSGK